ncbi:MAG: hypothetical protein GX122_03475 [Candidatus Cloacimonetes bacterium]|nr:hypothetical protein [Candidatus Cloacimonadota bacterium]
MQRAFLLASLLLLLLIIFSCAGEDKLEEDTTPPFPPTMIPHLGDVGDEPTDYYGQSTQITDDNNGIDTIPEGDWIRIMWKPFVDDDVAIVRVWRFDDIEPEPVLIDSILPVTRVHLDTSNNLSERNWYSYFIEVADAAGNSAGSDTVSFALLPKPVLLSPASYETIPIVGARAYWTDYGFATKYRFLLFDSMHNYVWHHDLLVAMEDDLFVDIPTNLFSDHSGESMYWRVDAFDWDEERQAYMGGKSNERILIVQ